MSRLWMLMHLMPESRLPMQPMNQRHRDWGTSNWEVMRIDRKCILFQVMVMEVQGSLCKSREIFISRFFKILCRSHDGQWAGSFLKQHISVALQIDNAACVLGTVSDRCVSRNFSFLNLYHCSFFETCFYRPIVIVAVAYNILNKISKRIHEKVERFFDFVCWLRTARVKMTTSEILLKKCVFIFCILYCFKAILTSGKPRTYLPPTSPSWTWLPYDTSHSLRLILRPQALTPFLFSLLGLQCSVIKVAGPRPVNTQCAVNGGEQDYFAGLLNAINYVLSELLQIVPERSGQGPKPI